MRRWTRAFAVLAVLATTAQGQLVEEDELITMVRSAYEKCTGAPWSTKLKAIREFMQGADLHTVRVSSAVVRPEFLDGFYYTAVPQEGYFLGICSTGGDLSNASKIRFEDLDPRGPAFRLQRIASLLGSQRIIRFEATKTYEDLSVGYFLYLPEGIHMGDLCEGQEVSVRFILTGARHFYLDNHFSQRFYGVVQRITPATACLLRCDHGHEYPPSAGYKVCPRDGLPLRPPSTPR